MEKSHDTLALRLSLILTKLNSGESFTARELAEEFNVSARTIQRDIKERLSYIPIEKNGDHYSMESYALGKLSFEDIKSFADVIFISKRAGVNLVEVIKNTNDTIREKIEIRQEINNLIAGKKLENRILSIMPFAMVIMLKDSSSGFLDPLMTTTFGHVIMTIALLMVMSGLIIAQKIMNIEV